MLIDIKLKKIGSGIRSQWLFEIYVDPKKFMSTHAFKSISPKWPGTFG